DLEIEEPDYGFESFVTIADNTIYDNYGPGISFRILPEAGVSPDGGPLDIIPEFLHIFGNDIRNNRGDGIRFSISIKVDAVDTKDGNGIYSYIAGAAVINYNTIQANLGSGIAVQLANFIAPEPTPLDGANGFIYYDFIIEKNVITDNVGSGIWASVPFSYGIYNNLIARNGGGCGYGVFLGDDSYGDVIHNTIVENGSGLQAPLMAGDTYLYNNIVANNLYFGLSDVSLPKAGDGNGEMGPVAYNDVWGNGSGPDDNYRNMPDLTGIDGNISLDPRFVSAMNLHLSTGSPCIDSGWDVVGIIISDDLEDTPRPLGMGFDMGCYEFRPNTWTPYILFPPAMTQLGRANAFWDCIKEQLPEDIADPAHAEALALVEEIQAVMARAGSLTNPVTINGLMNEAQALMAQLDALLQCGCS
ncbi:MAG: right-handed parallel beta-helix repeat-containing protein, partial [Candidatus Methanofastidiosa archaeon]|nr:right-handed parallel beta-helix repeat-containing protein [Candidatus Methanofastidiosa archaeon]